MKFAKRILTFNSKKQKTKRGSGRVLVFGAFDILHPGHRSFFRQAKRYGNELIVAVGRDHVIKRLKRRQPFYSEKIRLAHVAKEPLVDRAILASRDPRRRFEFIRRVRPSVIALGHDQTTYANDLVESLVKRKMNIMVVRLRPFQRNRFKSSLLRKKLR